MDETKTLLMAAFLIGFHAGEERQRMQECGSPSQGGVFNVPREKVIAYWMTRMLDDLLPEKSGWEGAGKE